MALEDKMSLLALPREVRRTRELLSAGKRLGVTTICNQFGQLELSSELTCSESDDEACCAFVEALNNQLSVSPFIAAVRFRIPNCCFSAYVGSRLHKEFTGGVTGLMPCCRF